MLAARELPLEDRLAACTAMKDKGNEHMLGGRLVEACHTYEQVQ